jgi:type I restriction enzyme S subunit
MINQELPKSWVVNRLGDFVLYQKGKKPKSLTKIQSKSHHIAYVNIKAFEQGLIDEYTDGEGCVLCEDNDFLMVWDGSRSGYVGRAIKGALGSTLVRIYFPGVNLDYAYFFLQSKFLEINSRAKGTGIPHVDPDLVWNYSFPLPPLAEQHRIVAKIEELFSELGNGIETLNKAKQQLKIYRQSVLKYAFEGKLTNPDVKDGELPEGWVKGLFKDVAIIKRGKSRHRPRDAKELFGGPYPFIQTGDVRNANGGVVKSYSQTYSEFGLSQSKLWPKGTLCLTIAANIGDVAFLGFDACFPDSVVGVIPHEDILSVNFLRYYIQRIKQELDLSASATAQKNLNVETLEKVGVLIPTLEEQAFIIQEIELRFSICDKIEDSIEQALQQAEALRQSILKRAFEGKLVPQDARDENASILLERIKAERAQAQPQNKTKAKKNK